MKDLVCKNCGSPNLIYKDGLVICQSCDSKFLPNEMGWEKTSASTYVTIHSAPGLKKAQFVKAYKNGDLICDYNGHNDVKIPVNSDSLFYFKVEWSRGITAKVSNHSNSHIFLWGDQYWGRLNGLKSDENNAVYTLQKRDELVGKSKWMLFFHLLVLFIPFVNVAAILTYGPWYLYKYFKNRKNDIEI